MLPPELIATLNGCAKADFVARRDAALFWQVAYSRMVIAGLLVEGPELLHEIGLILDKWFPAVIKQIPRFGWVVSGKRFIECAKLAAFVGWIFIVWGLIGELRASSRIVDFSARIEECSDAKVTKATLEAGEAHASATEAGAAAKTVGEHATEIKKQADELREQNEASIRRIEELRAASNESQAEIAGDKKNLLRLGLSMLPRTFWNQSGAINALKNFPKVQVIFEYQQHDDERALAEQINFVAKSVGWATWGRPQTIPELSRDESSGVRIFIGRKPPSKPPFKPRPNESVATSLQWYLQESELKAEIASKLELGPELSDDTILVLVGAKPVANLEATMPELGHPVTFQKDGGFMYGIKTPISGQPPKRDTSPTQ